MKLGNESIKNGALDSGCLPEGVICGKLAQEILDDPRNKARKTECSISVKMANGVEQEIKHQLEIPVRVANQEIVVELLIMEIGSSTEILLGKPLMVKLGLWGKLLEEVNQMNDTTINSGNFNPKN